MPPTAVWAGGSNVPLSQDHPDPSVACRGVFSEHPADDGRRRYLLVLAWPRLHEALLNPAGVDPFTRAHVDFPAYAYYGHSLAALALVPLPHCRNPPPASPHFLPVVAVHRLPTACFLSFLSQPTVCFLSFPFPARDGAALEQRCGAAVAERWICGAAVVLFHACHGSIPLSTPRIDPRRGRRTQRPATRSGCGCTSSPLTTSAARNLGQNSLLHWC